MIPLVFGLIITSIGSGIAISKIGKPYPFPIIGFTFLTIGVGLLSLLRVDTNYGLIFLFLLIWGVGLGFLMQTVVIIVQTSVDRANMASTITANT